MPRKKKTPSGTGKEERDAGTRGEESEVIKVKIADTEEAGKETEPEAVELVEAEREAEEALELSDEEIAKLVQEKEENYERLLRVQADFDNYRKRVQKEQASLLRYGAENALREILPVVDNMELAVDSARTHNNSDPQLLEGIEMILKQFFGVFEKLGVKPIESVNHPFDPNKHDALLRVHAPDAEEGTVVSEIRKGYYLHDKVLRPAQVTVGTREKIQTTEESSGE